MENENELKVLETLENALFNLQELPKLVPGVVNAPTYGLIVNQLENAIETLENFFSV